MAKIENLDFIKEIRKNQLKVRKHTPQFEYNISSFGLIKP